MVTNLTSEWHHLNNFVISYKEVTSVRMGNKRSVPLWFDDWMMDGPLYQQFTVLFSHAPRLIFSDDVWTVPVRYLTTQRASNVLILLMSKL